MPKTRSILKTTWYQWYESLINPTKKSESNVKQKIMKFFESKISNNITMGYKPKKIRGAFEGGYIE